MCFGYGWGFNWGFCLGALFWVWVVLLRCFGVLLFWCVVVIPFICVLFGFGLFVWGWVGVCCMVGFRFVGGWGVLGVLGGFWGVVKT